MAPARIRSTRLVPSRWSRHTEQVERGRHEVGESDDVVHASAPSPGARMTNGTRRTLS